MTLVGLENQSSISGFGISGKQHLVSMMLSVQQQQQQQYHAVHRGNVIVAPANQEATKAQQTQTAQQKRKMYSQTTTTSYGAQPASVAKRNARERNRVKQVNNGFATLRQHIPQTLAQALGGNTAGTQGGVRAGSKKLSKVETLRMAVEYIRNLKALLDEHDSETSGSSSSGSSAGSPKSEQEHQYQPTEIKFELKSESGDDEYQQPNHHYQHHHPQQQLHFQQRPSSSSPVYVPAPCSEASSSPTPSFMSEASSAGGSQGYGTNFNGTIYASHQDAYFGEEPMSPEDEELLDCISLWQQGL